MRADGVVGLSPPPPPDSLPYVLPSLEEACRTTAEEWQTRLSPRPKSIPMANDPTTSPDITLTANSASELGNLIFVVIEWMTKEVFDAAGERVRFTPPPGTEFAYRAASREMPTDVRVLNGVHTYYIA